MRKTIIFTLVIILAFFILLLFDYKLPTKGNKTMEAEINGQKVFLEIADSDASREKGLSQRKEICSNCGMLFIFAREGKYSFWMKDMQFDIDIIWMLKNKIVKIEKNISYKNQQNKNFGIDIVADKVLEFNTGFSEKLELKEGDSLNVN
ncbi:MAG: hypothetical protein COU40_00750 [Candidatus Moranbacteria bacterium CG10_big_fil_rev_8_21_14_0_10_35_21]|nr:MAG: hypothetical protein COU40_00750 [Candidatus Moranbacteria bacterium CG10_big_fil_rev_8_21_14_0_10_35_21]PJA88952.1 MAG: hypothetical protein CO139_00355 [Candidatus Moranbacteria bacterium CG_4_9_14_3_um_filter_36_9]